MRKNKVIYLRIKSNDKTMYFRYFGQYLAFIGLCCVLFGACNAQQSKNSENTMTDKEQVDKEENHAYTNELINESSPYLLQHAHNPVNWYPWGQKALDKAQNEDKMIVISVGYAACHWCHVMEHESFEDTTVAKLMNEHFVAIKVDREERPDVDQIYMDACDLMNQRGGWPLNALALHDGCLLYTSPSPRDATLSRMPSSA